MSTKSNLKKFKKPRFGWMDCNKLAIKPDEPLKPCPFCGAGIYDCVVTTSGDKSWYSVWCWNCASTSGYYDDRIKAVKAWNMRKEWDVKEP